MRVLMLGWDLPPHSNGGLGVAVEGLASALANFGVDLTLVLPRYQAADNFPFKIKFAGAKGKISLNTYSQLDLNNPKLAGKLANHGLIAQVFEFQRLIGQTIDGETYDLVHAHDWLSGPAGLTAGKFLDRPLIFQIHSTEIDRNGGGGVGGKIFQIEKETLGAAKRVVAVSHYTKRIINQNYQIPEEKIEVVHNALDCQKLEVFDRKEELALKIKGRKLVVFAGRLALQKGPDWFLKAAQIVARHDHNVYFVVAGDGDMKEQMINLAVSLGIADRVIFTGFLDQEELAIIYKNADVFVIPSVSEPFGLVALEASYFGTPVIISKNSGVLEVLNHCLVVDFWDSFAMAAKILAILKYRQLHLELKNNAFAQVLKFSWENSAQKCFKLYQEVVN